MNHLRVMLLGLIVAAVTGGVADAAPPGSVYCPESRTYHLLVLVPGGVTWDEAYDRARNAGDRLSTITSYAEDRCVISAFGDRLHGAWLGGLRPRGPGYGPWSWTTGETWRYTNWAAGENNNTANKEDRLVYWRGGSIAGMGWGDISQNWRAPGYVVEFNR